MPSATGNELKQLYGIWDRRITAADQKELSSEPPPPPPRRGTWTVEFGETRDGVLAVFHSKNFRTSVGAPTNIRRIARPCVWEPRQARGTSTTFRLAASSAGGTSLRRMHGCSKARREPCDSTRRKSPALLGAPSWKATGSSTTEPVTCQPLSTTGSARRASCSGRLWRGSRTPAAGRAIPTAASDAPSTAPRRHMAAQRRGREQIVEFASASWEAPRSMARLVPRTKAPTNDAVERR
jgi:hypothetical protein